MSRTRISFLLSFALAATALAQTPGRVQTTTRLVMIFSNLENQLSDAAAAANTKTASKLLTEDFEEWTPQPPGAPVPRDTWLRNAAKQFANGSIRQMAVKDIGGHAVVDFVWMTGEKAFFIVDIWRKQDAGWLLQQRYRAPVDANLYRGPVRPSGKD